MNKYPTQWQRKTMWAALTTLFGVMLMTIACSVVWIAANVIGFIQPILIPVAIAVILAYLLDPLVTTMTAHGVGRTKSVLALFACSRRRVMVLLMSTLGIPEQPWDGRSVRYIMRSIRAAQV